MNRISSISESDNSSTPSLKTWRDTLQISRLTLPFSLMEGVISPCLRTWRDALPFAGLTLTVSCDEHLPGVSGDAAQLRAALDCLIDNAIKFTPRGGQLHVEVRSDQGFVCVTVADTGLGLTADEIQQALTKPFYQAVAATTRRYRSYGLGLTLVRSVIAVHHGRFEITSEPGRGSRFTLKLPALPLEAKLITLPAAGTETRRILVVDDEENVVMLLQDGLSKLPNTEVLTATSGPQALALFEQQPFDLLITDYNMPDMDGLRLIAHIREAYPRTAVIMITAYSTALPTAQAAEVTQILDKPVQLADIRQAALRAMENSPAQPLDS